MGGNPCRLKILLNGDGIVASVQSIQEEIRERREYDGEFSEEAYAKELEIVKMFNQMENCADKATRLLCESGEYYGPYSNRLLHKHSD